MSFTFLDSEFISRGFGFVEIDRFESVRAFVVVSGGSMIKRFHDIENIFLIRLGFGTEARDPERICGRSPLLGLLITIF